MEVTFCRKQAPTTKEGRDPSLWGAVGSLQQEHQLKGSMTEGFLMCKEPLGTTQGETVKPLGLEVHYKSTNINISISSCPFKNGLQMSKGVCVNGFVQALCHTILSLN